jgi:hypothetical protein
MHKDKNTPSEIILFLCATSVEKESDTFIYSKTQF